jgi:hypothetical protein
MNIDNVLYKLQEEIKSREVIVLSGTVTSMESYRTCIGERKGLQFAIELIRSMMNGEEEDLDTLPDV